MQIDNIGRSIVEVMVELWNAQDSVPQENYLTFSELADALGVSKDEEGIPNTVEFVNACWGCQTNSKVRAMPEAERLRVTASAHAAFEQLVERRGR